MASSEAPEEYACLLSSFEMVASVTNRDDRCDSTEVLVVFQILASNWAIAMIQNQTIKFFSGTCWLELYAYEFWRDMRSMNWWVCICFHNLRRTCLSTHKSKEYSKPKASCSKGHSAVSLMKQWSHGHESPTGEKSVIIRRTTSQKAAHQWPFREFDILLSSEEGECETSDQETETFLGNLAAC